MIEYSIVHPILLAADAAPSGGLTQLLFFFAPLFAIWYFLVLRPQSQQRKKVQELLSSLKTGDRVVTTGGLYGMIMGFRDKDKTVQLQIADKVKVDVARSAITGVDSGESDDASKQDSASKGKN